MLKRVAMIALLAAIIPGCTLDHDWLERRPPERLSTMGHDLTKVPPGQSIPAAGPGVDLQ
jgi:hypothetical protein